MQTWSGLVQWQNECCNVDFEFRIPCRTNSPWLLLSEPKLFYWRSYEANFIMEEVTRIMYAGVRILNLSEIQML